MTTQNVQKKHMHLNIFAKNQGRAAALPCPTGSFAPGHRSPAGGGSTQRSRRARLVVWVVSLSLAPPHPPHLELRRPVFLAAPCGLDRSRAAWTLRRSRARRHAIGAEAKVAKPHERGPPMSENTRGPK
jgi:hypothetical protein